MDDSDYAEQLIGLYRGELYGELLFEALAERSDHSQDANMWRLLVDVERLTGRRLQARALALGAEHGVQLERAQARLRSQLEVLADKSMREVRKYYQARVPDNVARLRALQAAAPAQDHTLLTQVIAHSAVFGECLEHWLAGHVPAAEHVLRNYLESQSPVAECC